MSQHQEIISAQDSGLTDTMVSGTKQQNKRFTHDRRVLSVKAVWHSIISGRRKGLRRQINSSPEHIVDTHEVWLLPLILGVIVLCISDAYMTILLMNHGAIEANPVMALLIESSDNLFFWVKIISTSISMVLLLTFKNFTLFKYINGYHLIIFVLSCYTCLLGYEFVLLDSIL